MSQEREYHELYDRLVAEVATLHQSNRRRIRNGMRMLVVVTLGLMLLMFLAEGNKVFTLMLWIAAMFAVASYLIAVEYADYELQKKLKQITQMEQESLGTLLALPELPRLPILLRRFGETAEASAPQEAKQETAAPEALDASAAKAAPERTGEERPQEPRPDGAAQPAVSPQVLERLMRDPDKLADDLLLLTRALQNLSDDLRRGSKDDGRGEADA